MKIAPPFINPTTIQTRRHFLHVSSLASTTLAVLCTPPVGVRAAQEQSVDAADASIMQTALELEHEGIAAYRLAGASNLLTPATLKVAQVFMGHHEQHRDSLVELIELAGSTPVEPKTDSEYVQALNLGALKSEVDVVALAVRLERGAANAYIGQLAALRDRQLSHLFSQLAADESVHWAVLNNAMGQPVRAEAYLFG